MNVDERAFFVQVLLLLIYFGVKLWKPTLGGGFDTTVAICMSTLASYHVGKTFETIFKPGAPTVKPELGEQK